MSSIPFHRVASRRTCRVAGLWVAGIVLALPRVAPASEVDFERDIAPLLVRRCLECHNESGRSGGLQLTSAAGVREGGDSGLAIDPDKPIESRLLQRVLADEMPPPGKDDPQPLPVDEKDRLKQWVLAGSHWPEGRILDPYERTTHARAGRDWWSLQPIIRPQVPEIADAVAPRNPIDAFVRAALNERGWTPAPPADRRTLLRRLSYDLIGLPPSFEDYAAFERDHSPDAYERQVDRLLASPHFGERWGRYWLDLARYADTCGYERDQEKSGAWKYRDWVVQALNEDMPYDRFILEQLAGDELPDRSESTVIATGFLRLGTWNDEPNDPQEYKYERLEDMVHATGTAFLGLTIKCARCHDHKFDPIPQTDYYRVAGAFWAGFIEPRGSDLLGGPSREELGFDVFGWTDRGRDVPPLHLLRNGELQHPGPAVAPGNLSAVTFLDRPVAPPPDGATTTRRRLQLAQWITDPANPLTPRVIVNRLWQHHFGEGLVRTPDNFGFHGERPTHPELLDWLASELIEPGGHGADQRSAQSWTLKRLHKLIVMSETYRQSSNHPQHEEYASSDPANRLWWRAERQRLDADVLRDSLLAASGQLDLRQGGPGFKPTISPEALEGLSRKAGAWEASPPQEQRRRSIYMYLQRSLLPPLMTVFDQTDTTLPCGQRDVTTVAPQALALLNNEFVNEQSSALAARLQSEFDSDDERIVQAWRAVLGRDPTQSERAASFEHLEAMRNREDASTRADADQFALASLCHVFMNTNEFLYVD